MLEKKVEGETMDKMARLLPILLLCLGMLHCSDSVTDPGSGLPRALTLAEIKTINAFNDFGFDLFRQVIQNDEDEGNVFVSPLSVSMALGMTVNGARGETEEEMKSTLQFGSMDITGINEAYLGLMELLPGLDPEVLFHVANSIWYRMGKNIRQEFLSACQDYFDAEVTELDFASPDAGPTINAWVDDKTNGKINSIVPDTIPGDIVMYLINAIYFKGTWTYEFDPQITEDDVFYLPDGAQTTCRMMARPDEDERAKFKYFADNDVQVIDLPYADGFYSMTLVLPADGVDIGDLIADLDAARWKTWTNSLSARNGRLLMPRFETTYEREIVNDLTSLGMRLAFTWGADFTGMCKDGDLRIDGVKHKTYVKVDEEGTEAAAVTSSVLEVYGGGVDSNPFRMYINRPFLFAIREQNSGTILFIGKIVDPGYLE
jgi:serpin B